SSFSITQRLSNAAFLPRLQHSCRNAQVVLASHQDNSRWARRSAHSQRRYGTSRFNLGQRWPSRLVATAKEDRLTFAALRVISRHRRGGPYQISEATLGSLIPLRGPSSRRGRDFRVVRVFGLAYLACDLGTEWRR